MRANLLRPIVLAAALGACSTGTVLVVPGAREHPADPDAPTSAFVPAPDPLARGPQATRIPAAPEAPTPPTPTPPEGPHAGHHAGHAAAASAPAAREGAAAPSSSAATDRLANDYLALAAALARDDVHAAAAARDPLRADAEELARSTDRAVADAATAVAAATPRDAADLDALRAALQPLTDAVTALLRASPPSKGLRVAYCPMAHASWLQRSDEIANPYYGPRMPTCGRFTGAIEARKAEAEK